MFTDFTSENLDDTDDEQEDDGDDRDKNKKPEIATIFPTHPNLSNIDLSLGLINDKVEKDVVNQRIGTITYVSDYDTNPKYPNINPTITRWMEDTNTDKKGTKQVIRIDKEDINKLNFLEESKIISKLLGKDGEIDLTLLDTLTPDEIQKIPIRYVMQTKDGNDLKYGPNDDVVYGYVRATSFFTKNREANKPKVKTSFEIESENQRKFIIQNLKDGITLNPTIDYSGNGMFEEDSVVRPLSMFGDKFEICFLEHIYKFL